MTKRVLALQDSKVKKTLEIFKSNNLNLNKLFDYSRFIK